MIHTKFHNENTSCRSEGAGAPGELISIVIVTHNSGHDLNKCLNYLSEADILESIEVVVVDSGSDDENFALYDHKSIDVLIRQNNIGYGAACALGSLASSIQSAAILFLNPDVLICGATISLMKTSLLKHNLSAVGPRLLSSTDLTLGDWNRYGCNSIGRSGFNIVGDMVAEYKTNMDLHIVTKTEVMALSGACLMVRPHHYFRIKGFARDSFMYVEDTDLCWRLWKSGGSVAFLHWVDVVHKDGGSTPDSFIDSRNKLYYTRRNLIRFWKNNAFSSPTLSWVMATLTALGILFWLPIYVLMTPMLFLAAVVLEWRISDRFEFRKNLKDIYYTVVIMAYLRPVLYGLFSNRKPALSSHARSDFWMIRKFFRLNLIPSEIEFIVRMAVNGIMGAKKTINEQQHKGKNSAVAQNKP